MYICRIFRLVLVAISFYIALKAARLLLYGQDTLWNWCLQDSPAGTGLASSGSVIFDVVSLIALTPFFEELIFRYFGFKLIKYFLPKISSSYLIFLTSVAFAFSHNQYWSDGVNWSALVGIFLMGLVLGGIFVTRGKLFDSVIVHSTANLIVLISTEGSLFGNHCAELNGWAGGLTLSFVLVFAIFVTSILILGLRERPERVLQSESGQHRV